VSKKRCEVLSLRVTQAIKKEYEALSPADRKTVHKKMIDTLCRFLFARNHYDSSIYFDDLEEEE
jgi:hypothetical protein